MSCKVNITTSQIRFKERFPFYGFQWKNVYKFCFKWRQIINSISKTWEKVLKVLLHHQLFKNNCTLIIDKINSKESH